ncbi:MAG: hypothetical protein ACE5I1_29010 [bacterium]
MASTSIETVVKMMQALPEPAQDKVAEHLRQYLLELQDEIQWDISFKKNAKKLLEAARQAKKEIAAGKAKPMDYERYFS